MTQTPSPPVRTKNSWRGVNQCRILWVPPFIAASVLAVTAITKSPQQSVATSAVGVIVAIAAILAAVLGPFLSPPSTLRRSWLLVSLGATALLVIQSVIWPQPYSDDTVEAYFHGYFHGLAVPNATVRVGYNPSLTGWSTQDGFDMSLTHYLENEYHFTIWRTNITSKPS
jgi:hypothetical protein